VSNPNTLTTGNTFQTGRVVIPENCFKRRDKIALVHKAFCITPSHRPVSWKNRIGKKKNRPARIKYWRSHRIQELKEKLAKGNNLAV
jgi:hypothetical protein